MRFTKTVIFYIMTIILLAGCEIFNEPTPITSPGALQTDQAQIARTDTTMARRFTEPDQNMDDTDMVGNVLMWSKRHDELLEKNQAVREINNALRQEKMNFERELEQLQLELDRTKKELEEAITFMQDQEAELNKWRTDVLGHREEIRQIHTVQLQALEKIMKLLGAEMTELAKPTVIQED